MGSFYSTCSVSSMTLTNQKTSIQILAPVDIPNFKEHLNMIVSNEGAQAFFAPFGFPIHGEYYDYGHIDKIKRDKNVEILEEYFGVSIQDILQNIGRDVPENINHKDIFENLGITYYRTEVLEYLQRGWDEINLEEPKEWSSDSYISNFIKALDEKTNLLDDSEFRELMNAKELSSDDRMLLYSKMRIMSGSKMNENSYIQSLAKPNMFKELPITTEFFKEEILKQFMLLHTLSKINRLLIPSVYGSQETNWTSQYKLNDFVNDLLIEDMKERVIDCDDDYCKDEIELIGQIGRAHV